jgi:hypothetical protein
MKVIALDDGQVFVDGFNQDQNSGGHRKALPEGFEGMSMRYLCGQKRVSTALARRRKRSWWYG